MKAASLLGAAVVLAAAHFLVRWPPASVDLSPALSERLARLDSDLLLTYAATPGATMPSALRGVPEEVEALLRSMEAAGAGRVRVQIVDPTADGGAESWLEAVGLAPFHARSLEFDAEVEREVWSGLRIAHGPHGSAVIRAVTQEVVPDLQALVLSHLDLLERPRQPRVALAAPLAFNHLRRELRTRAELLECDFELDARIPDEADLLFWIDPGTDRREHLEALRAFRDRGGSIVIAGRIAPTLSRAFGLATSDATLEDEGPEGPTPLVRSIASDQDFRPLAGGRGGPNGTLLFAAPAAIVPAAGRLRELGLELFPLASTSASARFGPTTVRAPHSTLLAWLAPDAGTDLRIGSVVLSTSSSPFADEYLRHEAFAHRELLSVLVSSIAGEERLAIAGAAFTRPEAIPELAPARKRLLSLAVSLGAPLVLLLFALARTRRSFPRVRFPPRVLLAGSAAISVLLLARFAPLEASVDLTRARLNELAPGSRAIAAAVAEATRIELVFSPDAELPPAWRSPVREARALAHRFAAAGRRIAVVDAAPDPSDPRAIAALAGEGVLPLDAAGSAFAAIRLVRGGDAAGSQVLALREPAGFEHLEFRLAAALDRLERGAGVPRVAILASPTRLTPAEALRYQKRGIHPPGGGDRFGEARALLEANDFDVRDLDPARPEIGADTDVVVCLEPRRDAAPAIGAVARHLSSGGSALLAAQHFVAGPEPLFADVERLYFPSIGIELVRELLFDERRTVIATPGSPITRGLSELLLESPNRLRVDAAKLAANGLRASEVLWTSDRTWTHDWKGGPLPADVLRGPQGEFLGRQPLAAFFEGTFPPPGATPDLAAVAGGEGRGRLLLIGSSQVFADPSLRASPDAGQLLLNSVAALALLPEQAAILAHRAATPALGELDARDKIAWRIGIVGATPALLLILSLLRARRRR